jgi:hypothetical protein
VQIQENLILGVYTDYSVRKRGRKRANGGRMKKYWWRGQRRWGRIRKIRENIEKRKRIRSIRMKKKEKKK